MAISNYSELQTAITNWNIRSDTAFTNRVTEFITLAEARINRALDGRQSEADTTLTGTLGSRNLSLPSGFIEAVALFLTTFGDQQMLKPMVSGAYEQSTTNGTPDAWAIDGTVIELDCPCDRAHTFLFRYKSTLSIASTSTNWLLTAYPDVYLFAALVEAFGFARNMDAAGAYNQRFLAALDEMMWRESRNKAVATLSVDPALVGNTSFNINEG